MPMKGSGDPLAMYVGSLPSHFSTALRVTTSGFERSAWVRISIAFASAVARVSFASASPWARARYLSASALAWATSLRRCSAIWVAWIFAFRLCVTCGGRTRSDA